ncbi:MAG: hypothetical protein KBC19_04830 [Candidatus Moranbacteria bacterium]|jgi:hypothetical protein|nr:hypothetical protein [Candidatus Moranbacteria bacterium]
MKLPSYELGFNNETEFHELSDTSFEGNARLLLEGYFKFLPSLKNHLANLEEKTSEELATYNESVAQILYGPRILELFKSADQNKITELSETIKERLLRPKKEISESINLNNLGMVLVRPEARFLSDDIRSFLEEQGYETILEHPIVVSLDQYWMMYNLGFLQSNLSDFPTRTLTYTHGESKVFILHKNEAGLQENLVKKLKGASGRPSTTPTLRGTIVFEGLEKAKREDAQLFYDSIDPLGMYRAITSNKIESPDPYTECKDPVFYYAGQGVHMPEGHELATNMGVLLNAPQLTKIAERFKK